MSDPDDIEQGEDPGLPPRAELDTVTLARPLCIDGELSLTETETLTGRLA